MNPACIGARATLAVAVLATFFCLPAAPVMGRPLVSEAVVEGPADEIWSMISTKDGMESWMVPHAEVDLRAGGLIRTNHDPKGKIGDPQTVTNRIRRVIPRRLYSFEVAEIPEWFPFPGPIQDTWYEVTLIPIGAHRTRVRCVGSGFGDGPVGYAARAFVERWSDYALERLQKVVAERQAKRLAARSTLRK